MRPTGPRWLLTGAAALACSLVTSAAAAQSLRWYSVDVLVFAVNQPVLDTEVWPENPGAPDLDRSIEPVTDLALDESEMLPGAGPGGASREPAPTVPIAYRLLDPLQLGLRAQFARLKRSGRYSPLLHRAWRQPGFSRAEARPVHLSTGLVRESATPAARPPQGSAASSGFISVPDPVPRPPLLDGVVRLWRERYLHIDIDLVYSPRGGTGVAPRPGIAPVPPEPAAVPPRFRLSEDRRLRPGEIHYFDHPAFGVILRASRYELPPEPSPTLPPVQTAAPPPAGVAPAPAH